MRKTVVTALLSALIVPLAVAQKTPDLPLRYKKWLDEEVVYIITARERAVFLQLRTDKERDIFVEAFWKQRDPYAGDARKRIRGRAHTAG
ncbi:MAG: GWxTD domain-containing protein [Candidatus Moduliflexus flocculans]|nr:GWxTD domain-containing protein [Candidatus Moduliflexus flocculans]